MVAFISKMEKMEKQPTMWNFNLLTALFFCMPLFACKNRGNQPNLDIPQDVTKVIERPVFSSDSAYQFIQHQVDFGPRVPGSNAQKACASWLEDKLKQYGAEVQVQNTHVTTAKGDHVPCYNIIGSYQPNLKERILLASHWDSRPWADQDSSNRETPIEGANDGASGVGVLLEIARQIQLKTPEIGVDIIFFDVEDSGLPNSEESYCLGSQYWSKNPHKINYFAQNGILLDMVGAPNATFAIEGGSYQINPTLVNKVWDIASRLGYQNYFVKSKKAPIIDDHYYVYQNAKIPMIDIIHLDPTTISGFGEYWHTHRDNMDAIDKKTLQAVGETVLATIRNK